MPKTYLFSPYVLNYAASGFDIDSVVGISEKRRVIEDWNQYARSGRLELQNETAVATDFINEIFGKVLEYYYGNTYSRSLEKELKTLVSGKKPDGALGFFGHSADDSIVSAVIEMKPYGLDLDAPQNRKNARSPVDQAFKYAREFGPSCKWVFVSNMRETRMYRDGDVTAYELFTLESLLEDDSLRRFLFLCGKDRLIRPAGDSPTDRLLKDEQARVNREALQKEGHVIDQIYTCLKRFDGLAYFDANIIANASPFHRGEQRVWHFHEQTLMSTEEGVYDFFENLIFKSDSVSFKKDYLSEVLDEGVRNPAEKAIYIIRKFNKLLIREFQCFENPRIALDKYRESQGEDAQMNHRLHDYGKQLRSFKIPVTFGIYDEGSLLPALYRNDFREVLRQLYSWEGTKKEDTPEALYLHVFFGTNNFKTAYAISCRMAERTKKVNLFAYFLSQYNRKLLNNLLRSSYWLDDQKALLRQMKQLDLFTVMADLNVYDPDIRDVLSDFLTDRYRHRSVAKIEELTAKLENVKSSFTRGPDGMFPDYTTQLIYGTHLYFASGTLNYLVGEHYTEHRRICKKILNAFLLNFSIDPAYRRWATGLNQFLLNLMLFDIDADELESLLKKHDIHTLVFQNEARDELGNSMINYLRSRRSDYVGFNAMPSDEMERALLNSNFRNKYINGFECLLLILSRCELPSEQGENVFTELRYFIHVADRMYGQRLRYLPAVIGNEGLGRNYRKRANVVLEMLDKSSINRYKPISTSVLYLLENYREELELDESLWNKFFPLASEEKSVLYDLIRANDQLWPAAKKQLKELVFGKLDGGFDPMLYVRGLANELFLFTERNDFDELIRWANNVREVEPYELYNGKPRLKNFMFLNFLSAVHAQKIQLPLESFTDLSDWQIWALRPELYDPTRFRLEWLHIFDFDHFHENFAQNEYICEELESAIREDPNSEFKDLYIRCYFAPNRTTNV